MLMAAGHLGAIPVPVAWPRRNTLAMGRVGRQPPG